jgi:hypothetical protein
MRSYKNMKKHTTFYSVEICMLHYIERTDEGVASLKKGYLVENNTPITLDLLILLANSNIC